MIFWHAPSRQRRELTVYKFPKLINPKAKISEKAVLKEPVRLGEVALDQCVIGKWTYIGGNTRVGSKTKIGAYCSIGQGVKIAPADHPMSYLSTHPFQYDKKLFNGVPGYDFPKKKPRLRRRETKIGNDVWIGADAIIISGVTIGTGAVIGASAVVTKDVEPYTVVAGVPAKPIKRRFPDDICERLLKTEWWIWDPSSFADVAWDNPEQGVSEIEAQVEQLLEAKRQSLMGKEGDPDHDLLADDQSGAAGPDAVERPESKKTSWFKTLIS
jgi:acetyltransferase-like isoleucine patch superfamily enzyme